jgi:hypothetical protein
VRASILPEELPGVCKTMRFALRIVLVGGICRAIPIGVVGWLTGLDWWGIPPQRMHGALGASSLEAKQPEHANRDADQILVVFPDPNAQGTDRKIILYDYEFDNGVYQTAEDFMGPHWD